MPVNRRMLIQGGALLSGAAALSACATGNATAWASDPLFNQPYIDIDEWRDAPVRHRYVHGGFRGTDARFVFYFPPPGHYQGRFFQYISPVPVPEDAVYTQFGNDNSIGFAIASGAYAVASNQGGAAATGVPGSGVDPTIAAYRASAASAEYSRVVAREMYGGRRPYGYVYGGSGGAFRTLGCIENTTAWDGAVPFVMGSPMAIPNVYTVRCHAMRILKNRFPQIADAIEPGGSGDMYAGLNEEERGALLELLKMGFPARALQFHDTMGLGAFSILFPIIEMIDAAYFEEFWRVPGYLGAAPPPSLSAARVQHRTTIRRIVMSDEAAALGLRAPQGGGPRSDVEAWQNLQRTMGAATPFAVALQVRDAPPPGRDLTGASVQMRGGAASGRKFGLSGADRDYVMLSVTPIGGGGPPQTAGVAVGDEVTIDNSNFLAAQTYHRHQVPGSDYPVWDQFRNPDGTPKHPQRPSLIGPSFNQNASGVLPTGRFTGKMIVVETLLDYDAFPWQADWYRRKVEANLGARIDDRYRLWFVDQAVHGGPHTARTISYDTVLQQALRDLSAWVERGTPAPASTNYRVDDGQIVVPARANDRRGVQPVAALTANGGARAAVRVGEEVTFVAAIEAPRDTGQIVSAEWDFEGNGAFGVASAVTPATSVTVTTRHAFARPGTYFAGLRFASQREGDQSTPFAKIYNLARVRVVVA